MKMRIILLLSLLLTSTALLADGDDRNHGNMDKAERDSRAAQGGGRSGGAGNNAAGNDAAGTSGIDDEGGAGASGGKGGKGGNAGANGVAGDKDLAAKAREIRDRAKASSTARGAKGKLSCNVAENDITDNDAPYPGADLIHHTNNLRRPTGIAINAVGDRIYFTGKLVDSGCVPIQDALVEIWQADNSGLYSYGIGNRKLSTDQSFLGTGRTETDNEGNFQFLTVFPGFYENRAPHINFRITHPDFNETTGEVFFEYHPRNGKDPYYKRLAAPYVAQSVTLGEKEMFTDRSFHIQIPLKGTSTYKRF